MFFSSNKHLIYTKNYSGSELLSEETYNHDAGLVDGVYEWLRDSWAVCGNRAYRAELASGLIPDFSVVYSFLTNHPDALADLVDELEEHNKECFSHHDTRKNHIASGRFKGMKLERLRKRNEIFEQRLAEFGKNEIRNA